MCSPKKKDFSKVLKLVVNNRKINSIIEIFLFVLFFIIYIQGAHIKYPDFFRMGSFIDSTHMKL